MFPRLTKEKEQVNKRTVIAVMCVALLLCATPAMAAPPEGTGPAVANHAVSIFSGAAVGCGLIIIGGALGIGKIGAAAVESMARQPEMGGNINTAMIISAALIEGVTFFGLIVCLLTLFFK